MKPDAFTFVVVADQIASRSTSDQVPQALAALESLATVLPFERTAGDEIQALVTSPETVVSAMARLTRLPNWRIGVGLGQVETPLPSSTRIARGPAYYAARTAIEAAKDQPNDFALHCWAEAGPRLIEATAEAETALWLLRNILSRRSRQGWEVVELLDTGLTNAEAALSLEISPSAISQRLKLSAREEGRRGAALCAKLLSQLQTLGKETE